MRCYRGDFSAERFAEKKGNGRWGRGGRLEARGGGTVFFFRNRFRHSCRSLPGLNNEGAGGGRDIWRVLMFVSIFEIRRFIRVRWIVVRSVINIVGVRVWAIGVHGFSIFFFLGENIYREILKRYVPVIFNLIIVPIICNVIFLVFFFFISCVIKHKVRTFFFKRSR